MKETKEITHKRLSSVRSKNSNIELLLRKKLFSLGHRYRLHDTKVYGKPDIVFPRYKVAIFCDSHFWHGYRYDQMLKNKLKINRRFWIKKIQNNMKRDKLISKTLKNQGWKVLRFWEHQIENGLLICIVKVKQALNDRKLEWNK